MGGKNGVKKEGPENRRLADGADNPRQPAERLARGNWCDILGAAASDIGIAVELASEAIIVSQGESIIFVNPKACELTGYTRQELIGRPALDMVHPDDHPMVHNRRQGRLKGERPPEVYPYRILDKQGRVKWVEVNVARIPWGGSPAILCFMTDITDRKRAEQALVKSEKRYRLLAENTSDVIWHYDLATGKIAYISPSVKQVFGYSHKEALQLEVKDWNTPESYEFLMNLLGSELQVEASGDADPLRIHEIEVEQVCKNGDVMPVGMTLSFVRDQENNPVGVVGVSRDISERKKAEKALKESEARYRGVFDGTNDGIAVYRAIDQGDDFVFVDFNAAGESIEMVSRKAVVGKSVKQIFPGIEAYGILDVFRRVWRSGSPEGFPTSFYQDGRIAGWRDNYVYKLPSGELVAIYSDVTERKQAEQDKALLESQLRQAQKMEALGTLAGGIAHDFNNILTAITGFSELALESAQNGSDNAWEIEKVIGAAAKAKDLVRQILTFSRKGESALRPLDLNQVIRHTLDLLERTIPKMIKLKHDLGSELPSIKGDPAQLAQVLMNLGANSSDSMPEGGTFFIQTSLAELDRDFCGKHLGLRPGTFIHLKVSDNGIGMDEDTRRQIFDPFFTTKEVGKGTGLGLATVFGIVKSHGGYIGCESSLGQGTAFDIYLPASIEKGTETRLPEETAEGGEHDGGTILLVDDDQSVREVGKRILVKENYHVFLASSGEEALNTVDSSGTEIDLIILDLGMPGMGGLQCLRELLARDPSRRVLVSSGYGEDKLTDSVLELGAVAFVAKPFRRADFTEAVKTAISDNMAVAL